MGNKQQKSNSSNLFAQQASNIDGPYTSSLDILFNDDEPFQEVVKQTEKDANISLSLKAQRSQVKLGEQTIMPGMCSLMAEGGTRSSVDLICVIDVSGSMGGEKIQLVR